MKKTILLLLAFLAASASAVLVYQSSMTLSESMGTDSKDVVLDTEEGDASSDAWELTEEALSDTSSSVQAGNASSSSSSRKRVEVLEETSSSGESTSSASSVQALKASYAAYTEGVIGNGKTSVLFFHAPWCPYCRESDARLKKIFGEGKATKSVYRVDYDSAKDLRARYGVVSQDTFVTIDGKGDEVSSILNPTENDLKNLLQ